MGSTRPWFTQSEFGVSLSLNSATKKCAPKVLKRTVLKQKSGNNILKIKLWNESYETSVPKQKF
jgi:hypothetical protein